MWQTSLCRLQLVFICCIFPPYGSDRNWLNKHRPCVRAYCVAQHCFQWISRKIKTINLLALILIAINLWNPSSELCSSSSSQLNLQIAYQTGNRWFCVSMRKCIYYKYKRRSEWFRMPKTKRTKKKTHTAQPSQSKNLLLIALWSSHQFNCVLGEVCDGRDFQRLCQCISALLLLLLLMVMVMHVYMSNA